MMSMLVKSRLKCHRLSMRRWRGERPDISSKKSPSTWGPVFEEKIVEVPTVEVREVIKQVSKPEALGCRFSNCWQLLLESFASILHLFL